MNVTIMQHPSTREIIVSLTRKGQVTIPAAVRRFLALETDSKLALILDVQTKTVRLQVPRYPTISSAVGAAGSLNKKISWQEMLDIARTDGLMKKNHPRRDE